MNLKRPGLGAVVFGTALLLRAAWVLVRWYQTGPALEFPDEALHWQLARNLIEQGTLVTADGRYAARMPLYPLFLSLFAWAGDAGILLARLTQVLTGAATAWIAYTFVRRVADRRAAIVAGVLVCVDPYAVFFVNLLLTEVLFSLFAVTLTACVGLLLLDRRNVPGSDEPNAACRRRAVWNAATIGVALLGAAVLMTRPSAFGWILLLWLLIWWRSAPRVDGARRVALCLTVLVACLLPWGLRNRAVIGSWAWLSTNGGVTLYDGQGPQADGSSNQAFLNQLPELAGLGEVERDRRLRQLAIQQMRDDPARVLRLACTKFLRTWSPVPNVAEYRGGAAGVVSAVFTGAVLLLAFVGLARCLFAGDPAAHSADQSRARERAGRHRRLHLLLWLPVVYFTLVHCVFVGSLRYRVPLMPFLEIAAATTFLQMRTRR